MKTRPNSMTFSGKNLAMVREALDLAHDELYNMIATCPDVSMYEEEIEEYEEKQRKIRNLMIRIDNKE